MSEKSMQVIKEVGGWYVTKKETYIRFFVVVKSLHLLPKSISNNCSLQEVSYHTVLHGVGEDPDRDKKFP
jgi:hypothetical protein